jgi:protein pelota
LIVSGLDPRHGRCSLIIETADDLWTLRRLVSKGDVVVTRSSRVMKREEEYSRPDKGERVSATIALAVDEIHLDSSIERIRVRGRIVESSDENVTKAGSHSFTLTPGSSLTVRKERWTSLYTTLLRPTKGDEPRFVIASGDRRETGVGVLSGSHLSFVSTVESGLGGKMSEESEPGPYISKVAELLAQTCRPGDVLVLGGPGNFKNGIANAAKARLKSVKVELVDGVDVTGSDGVRAVVKSQAFREVAKDTALVALQRLVDEVVRRISTGDRKVAYGFPRVKEAADSGAVEACAVSDDVFSPGTDEEALVQLLNRVESTGGHVRLADSSMEFGKQVSSFGGIVALLRYSLRAWQ